MPPCRRHLVASRSRRAMVLVVVLVAIVLLSLAGYTFAQLMFAEREAAWANGRALQARALVDSGVAFIEQQLAQSRPQISSMSGGGAGSSGFGSSGLGASSMSGIGATSMSQGGSSQAGAMSGAVQGGMSMGTMPTADSMGMWYDNRALFCGQLVTDGGIPRDRGRFTVLSPRVQYGMPGGVRYGLEDESGRLNLNTLLLLDSAYQSAVTTLLNTYQASTSGQSGASGGGSSGGGGSGGGGASSASGSSAGGSSSSGSSMTASSPAEQALLMLPGMTINVADAILDWLDPDDTPRSYGAERESYSSLGYVPRNGPLASVEELLLVKGVTPALLFGADLDHNAFIDQQEAASGMTMPTATQGSGMNSGTMASSPSGSSSSSSSSSSNSSTSSSVNMGSSTNMPTGSMNQGWAAYLTVYSQESNLQPNGLVKINLNSPDLQYLYQSLSMLLGNEIATFVVGYRQGQVVTGSQTTVSAAGKTPDFTKPGTNMLASPLDLVGCKVQVSFQGDQQPSVINSPFDATPAAMPMYLPMLLAYTTIVSSPTVPGRININTATPTVLSTIPGMDSTTLSMIVNAQMMTTSQGGAARLYPTWLYIDNIVSLDTMKKLMPYVTAGGSVFRGQIVGFYDRSGPTVRAEVVVDATTPAPRVVLWRDLTHLGRGYPGQLLGASPSP